MIIEICSAGFDFIRNCLNMNTVFGVEVLENNRLIKDSHIRNVI